MRWWSRFRELWATGPITTWASETENLWRPPVTPQRPPTTLSYEHRQSDLEDGP